MVPNGLFLFEGVFLAGTLSFSLWLLCVEDRFNVAASCVELSVAIARVGPCLVLRTPQF